ncbi:MAG: cytochrome P450 [Anaerolineae bacterium]|nr:cytochrome P450 [Anaerolineae bacterium]
MNAAQNEFAAYLDGLLQAGLYIGGILEELVNLHRAGEFDRRVLVSSAFLFLDAGHDNVGNHIANGVLALIRHPEQMRALQDNPALVKDAAAEMLRYDGPVDCLRPRYAFEAVELGSQVIRRGDKVYASVLAANRDPEKFENPNVFDITRDKEQHLAFGKGDHFCLGSQLARIEAEVAITTLLARRPTLSLAVGLDEIEWNESLLLHGMKAFPVRVGK